MSIKQCHSIEKYPVSAMNSFVIVEVQILLLQRVLDSDQLGVVRNPGDLHEKIIKTPYTGEVRQWYAA